jgi:phosphatidylserine synthase
MNRYVTLLGVILAVLALIFQLASILSSAVLLILIAAVIIIGIGSITGM